MLVEHQLASSCERVSFCRCEADCRLLPIMAVVVVAYLVTGIAMPVLPIHVRQGLGLGTFVVGLVAGTQFAATLILVASLRAAPPQAHTTAAFTDVVRAVWRPGAILALSGVGFAAITTFVPLLFVERGWSQVWLALTTFSVAFMVARMALGHLPDRIGGANVALVRMAIEAVGLVVVWRAPGFTIALRGVALSARRSSSGSGPAIFSWRSRICCCCRPAFSS